MAFTTTDIQEFFEQGWELNTKEIIELGNDVIHDAAVPFIAGEKEWENYTDDIVYETDKAMREWIETMRQDTTWSRSQKSRRYRFSQLFRILFHKEWDNKQYGKYMLRISKVFAYYSSRLTTTSKDDTGKWGSKTGYVISPSRLKQPPYSLKLRLEWLAQQGKIPTAQNMKLPKDNLEIGHARNPKTEANMERRRQQKRDRYNEYQRKRNDEIKARSLEGQEH